jgi:predicted dehydrogenase
VRDLSERPIRWGIAGTGIIASEFAEGLALVEDCELVGVASRSAETAEGFGDRFGVHKRYGSYESMADSDDVDVVYVATPHSRHRSDTLLYLDSGKAVLCEKPFAVNQSEAVQMIDAARRHRLFCMEAMWSRHLPAYVRIAELLDEGVVGTPLAVEAVFGVQMPFDPSHRLFDLNLGGGALLDLGVYPTQLSSLVLGRPDDVVARGHLGETGVDEHVAAVLHHRDGALGIVVASITGTLSCTARISGTEGAIELPAFMHCPSYLTIVRAGKSERVDCPIEGNGLHYQAAELQRCLRAGLLESPIMPLEETSSILRTLDVIREQIGLVYPGDHR